MTTRSDEPASPPEGPDPRRLITLDRAHAAQALLRGISHDLRNNLQVLSLSSSLGLAGDDPELATRVDRAIEAMTETLDLLSALGRNPDPADRVAPLDLVLARAVRLAAFQRNAPAVAVTLAAAPTGARVRMQASELTQLLLGLITNAKEARHPGGEVVVASQFPAGGWVEVTVDDRGPGPRAIPDAPFGGSQPAETHGGIGLAAARALVAAADGRLVVEARPGGGTRVRVTLPVAE